MRSYLKRKKKKGLAMQHVSKALGSVPRATTIKSREEAGGGDEIAVGWEQNSGTEPRAFKAEGSLNFSFSFFVNLTCKLSPL